jgi:hypothetical protein
MPGRDIRRPLVKYNAFPSGLTVAEVSSAGEFTGEARFTGALHPFDTRSLL